MAAVVAARSSYVYGERIVYDSGRGSVDHGFLDDRRRVNNRLLDNNRLLLHNNRLLVYCGWRSVDHRLLHDFLILNLLRLFGDCGCSCGGREIRAFHHGNRSRFDAFLYCRCCGCGLPTYWHRLANNLNRRGIWLHNLHLRVDNLRSQVDWRRRLNHYRGGLVGSIYNFTRGARSGSGDQPDSQSDCEPRDNRTRRAATAVACVSRVWYRRHGDRSDAYNCC